MLSQVIRQRLAVDVLENEVLPPIDLLEAMDRRNVGMIQGSQQPRLPVESLETLLVSRELVREALDRHLTIQLGVLGEIDHAHPAATDLANHLIGADLGGNVRHGGP